jgi:hypothetical protein
MEFFWLHKAMELIQKNNNIVDGFVQHLTKSRLEYDFAIMF